MWANASSGGRLSGGSAEMGGGGGGGGNAESKHLGMTAPISQAPPTAEDLQRTEELIEAMKPHGVFESEEEMNHRMQVLATMNELVKQWIKDLSVEKNMPPNLAETVGGHVFTFGSYRLGVHNKGADIDALCVVPRHIHREDYFSSFYAILQGHPDVTELRAVPDAFVPVIKMAFDGIDIDLTFARLALKEVAQDQSLLDPMLLKNLDEKCVRSLNGCRVTDEILRQVPCVDTFRVALRAIKLWAKRHGIYSNVLGYLGGVSWAMLVARVCQLYPNADSATLVQKFFLVFLKWQWPQPVLLKKPEEVGLGFNVWDPRRNVSDRFHLMPIITPAYPQQNSTFNVSQSTLEVMKKEFEVSLAICEQIWLNRAGWDKLFETPNFFGKYKHFIVLEASSNTEEDQLAWYGLVESKVRHLVLNLERGEGIDLAHVWPKTYPSLEPERANTCCYWFIGLQLAVRKDGGPQSLDLTTPIRKFTEVVLGSAMGTGTQPARWREGMKVDAVYKKRKELTAYLPAEERGKLKSVRSTVNNAAAAATGSSQAAKQQHAKTNEPPSLKRRNSSVEENQATNNGAATAPSVSSTEETSSQSTNEENSSSNNGGGGGDDAGDSAPPLKRQKTPPPATMEEASASEAMPPSVPPTTVAATVVSPNGVHVS